ncbi:MAG TPA: dihydrodipicolinate reductase C-terminal domain-containing protein [Pyrinomonadaceae bacterium]|nr:dihydrodipicolinate reductase C-terminal domain-containing protein [Pyrinomonadaceae bacterium]
MRIALFGHGAMGRLVEERARGEGHEIALVLTSRDAGREEELGEQLRGLDAAIDFSVAGAVAANAKLCARAKVPLVIGTTGWREEEEGVRRLFEEHGGALLYGANFSIGVNLFYRVVERAAELFARFDAYSPFIEEAHHARKRDAPSGTALKLREHLAARYEGDIPVSSTRAGNIPGTHRVGFDSAADQVLLTHTARSREGFAAGALAAARWIQGRRGVYEFTEMIDEMLGASFKT